MPNAQKLMADRSRMQESRAERKTMLALKARDKATALAAAKKTGQSASEPKTPTTFERLLGDPSSEEELKSGDEASGADQEEALASTLGDFEGPKESPALYDEDGAVPPALSGEGVGDVLGSTPVVNLYIETTVLRRVLRRLETSSL